MCNSPVRTGGIVTHNLAQARSMADDVGLLWQLDGAGQFIEYGRARDIFEHPTHELTAAYVAGMRG